MTILQGIEKTLAPYYEWYDEKNKASTVCKLHASFLFFFFTKHFNPQCFQSFNL